MRGAVTASLPCRGVPEGERPASLAGQDRATVRSPAELVERERCIGRARALEECDCREREGVDGLVTPFAHQARDDGQSDGLEGPVRLELTVEPLDVARLASKEKGSVPGEKDVLVPALRSTVCTSFGTPGSPHNDVTAARIALQLRTGGILVR